MGTDPMEVDVAGNPGVLEAKKDRVRWSSDQSTFGSPVLHWWESNQMYTMTVQDPAFFLPDVEQGLQKMLQVARSMY